MKICEIHMNCVCQWEKRFFSTVVFIFKFFVTKPTEVKKETREDYIREYIPEIEMPDYDLKV